MPYKEVTGILTDIGTEELAHLEIICAIVHQLTRNLTPEQIEKIKKTAIDEIAKAEDLQTLEDARVKYLGKKGELTAVLRGMGGLSPEERPIIGGLVNEAKESLEKLIEEKEEKSIILE